MRLRRTFPILVAVILVAAAIALVVTLRQHAPPEPARLLPGADGFLYVNLGWIRTFSAGRQLPPVAREPEYQAFVDETGFEFERDLDEAAFAVHYPERWGNGTGGASPEPRYSEIFVGKFDSARLIPYLKKLASNIENYGSIDIYNIPFQGHVVRVAMLSYDLVAVSNHPDPEVMRGMVDRSRKLASPFGGPSLLRKFYRQVPLASAAFAILRIQSGAAKSLDGLGSWSFLFSKPAVAVVSARYLRALHLRAEIFADSPQDAQSIADKVAVFLTLFHAAEGSVGTQGTDADVKAFFDSFKIEHSENRATLSATASPAFIGKMLAGSPANPAAPVPATPPPPNTPPLAKPKSH
jgi:hypothetical protein